MALSLMIDVKKCGKHHENLHSDGDEEKGTFRSGRGYVDQSLY